jgi:hypothetical protein
MRAPALMRPDVLPAPPVPDMTIYRVCECVASNTARDLEAHHVGRRRTRKSSIAYGNRARPDDRVQLVFQTVLDQFDSDCVDPSCDDDNASA